MKVNRKHIKDASVEDLLNDPKTTILKKKRERVVFKNKNLVYKLWVQNWPQGDITKYAFDSGYYDKVNCLAIDSLLYDDSGERGYIMNVGESLGTNWKDVVRLTTRQARIRLMKSLLSNSDLSKGIYTDLHPSNMIKYKGEICLIDLDSFNSFSFIFNRNKMSYEKFDLEAWWKPHETITRDLDKFYREYFKVCLGKELDFKINEIKSIEKMKEIVENMLM